MTIRSAPLLLTCLALLCGCRARPGHPVFESLTGVPEARPVAARAPLLPVPDGAPARAALLQGFEHAETALRQLRTRATPAGVTPRLCNLPNLERAAYQRAGRSRTRTTKVVRNAAAVGYCASFPASPRAVADLVMDPEVEERALYADGLVLAGVEFDIPGATRRQFRVEMLRRGEGPFRVDLRFTFRTERWDLPDGTILMRHDLCPDLPAEHVSVYRGVTLVAPEGTGSRVTEFFVMGTDVRVPFFLRRRLRRLSVQLFADRVRTLWQESARLTR